MHWIRSVLVVKRDRIFPAFHRIRLRGESQPVVSLCQRSACLLQQLYQPFTKKNKLGLSILHSFLTASFYNNSLYQPFHIRGQVRRVSERHQTHGCSCQWKVAAHRHW